MRGRVFAKTITPTRLDLIHRQMSHSKCGTNTVPACRGERHRLKHRTGRALWYLTMSCGKRPPHDGDARGGAPLDPHHENLNASPSICQREARHYQRDGLADSDRIQFIMEESPLNATTPGLTAPASAPQSESRPQHLLARKKPFKTGRPKQHARTRHASTWSAVPMFWHTHGHAAHPASQL